MKRKIYSELWEWKNAKRRRKRALILEGAYGVGKSYIAEEFAKNEYESYLRIDFSRRDPEVSGLFDRYLYDLDQLFRQLSLRFQVPLQPGKSLIILDEFHLYSKARAAIRHLAGDRRFDWIETRSSIDFHRDAARGAISPKVHYLKMYPMDFEEFLWAAGDRASMPYIRNCFEKRQPAGTFHRRLMDQFRTYMIVGGMPRAVAAYVRTRDFTAADQVKRDILAQYRKNIDTYATRYRRQVKTVWDSIPDQLRNDEKRFRTADLEAGARFADYARAFQWLSRASLIQMCHSAAELEEGLRQKEHWWAFKCYLADTGLLLSHTYSAEQIRRGELYQKLLLNRLEFNRGILMENMAAQMLAANGHPLYFYSHYARDPAERMDIDFLIERKGEGISPVEVKSAAAYPLTSLKKFARRHADRLSALYVIHSADYREEDGVVCLPIYMTPLL